MIRKDHAANSLTRSRSASFAESVGTVFHDTCGYERVAADRRLYGQLAAAGMTDAGIDLKGLRPGTFQRIKGVEDGERAEFYLENAWNAMKYLLENYPEVFVGMGIPTIRL